MTTDMGIPLEKNQTFLLPGYDLEQIVEFLKKNGLGQLKEEICCSGCMEYPLFEFQEETLKKLDRRDMQPMSRHTRNGEK